MSYYLKYRPQKISELDLDGVRKSLGSILKTGKFSHAYLFAGPKGTGKTSSARIVAKLLNCEKNREQLGADSLEQRERHSLSEPCGECDSCKAVTKGSSMAVVEMDAASNRGIDDIRQLRDRVGLAPAGGLFTVYVIDEVHMLTTEAFNALLKTLEEPPTHAVFVLCTTGQHKLPDTIVSRCTLVQFTKATGLEVIHSLNKAVKGEELKIEDSVLEVIAGRVDGSFRDGMKLLEQLGQQASGKTITINEVDEMTGYSALYDPESLVNLLWQSDMKAVIDDLSVREQGGVDFGVFGIRLLESLRDKLIDSVVKKESVLELTDLINRVDKAVVGMRQSMLPLVLLEVCLLEWIEERRGKSYEFYQESPPGRRALVTSHEVSDTKTSKDDRDLEFQSKNNKSNSRNDNEMKKNIKTEEGDLVIDFSAIQERWQEVLAQVKSVNMSVEALLKAAKPRYVEDGRLIIEVAYPFHKEQLEQDRHKRLVEVTTEKTMGMRVRIGYVLASEVKQIPVDNITGKVVDEKLAEAVEEIFG